MFRFKWPNNCLVLAMFYRFVVFMTILLIQMPFAYSVYNISLQEAIVTADIFVDDGEMEQLKNFNKSFEEKNEYQFTWNNSQMDLDERKYTQIMNFISLYLEKLGLFLDVLDEDSRSKIAPIYTRFVFDAMGSISEKLTGLSADASVLIVLEPENQRYLQQIANKIADDFDKIWTRIFFLPEEFGTNNQKSRLYSALFDQDLIQFALNESVTLFDEGNPAEEGFSKILERINAISDPALREHALRVMGSSVYFSEAVDFSAVYMFTKDQIIVTGPRWIKSSILFPLVVSHELQESLSVKKLRRLLPNHTDMMLARDTRSPGLIFMAEFMAKVSEFAFLMNIPSSRLFNLFSTINSVGDNQGPILPLYRNMDAVMGYIQQVEDARKLQVFIEYVFSTEQAYTLKSSFNYSLETKKALKKAMGATSINLSPLEGGSLSCQTLLK